MTAPRLASTLALLALTGCGHVVAPAPAPDGGTAPATVTLVLTSDEYGADPGGTAIRGATVLVDSGSGVERLVTDGTGTVQFAAAGVVAAHVVYHSDLGFRVYSLVPPHAGRIELGRRPAFDLGHSMTFTVPDNGSGSFTMRLPGQCAAVPQFSAASLGFSYSSACEGEQVRAVVFTREPSGAMRGLYLDAGQVSLVNKSTHPVTGNYALVDSHTIQIANLPTGTSSVSADIVLRSAAGLVSFAPTIVNAMPQAGAVTLNATSAPGADTLRIEALAGLPVQYSSSTTRIAPASFAAAVSLDGQTLPPLFSSLVLTHPPSISWTAAATGGTMVIVDANAGSVLWDSYLDPSATAVDFPALPADLGVPVPTAFDFASVRRIDVPGAAAADIAQTIDRQWSSWPDDPALLPAEGGALASILYTSALGPP